MAMNKQKKIATKFEIEEVEDRVEFFFLSGALGKVFGVSPYTRGTSSENWGSWCQPPQNSCGSTSTWLTSGGHHHHHHY